jgi:hypothetical protein
MYTLTDVIETDAGLIPRFRIRLCDFTRRESHDLAWLQRGITKTTSRQVA